MRILFITLFVSAFIGCKSNKGERLLDDALKYQGLAWQYTSKRSSAMAEASRHMDNQKIFDSLLLVSDRYADSVQVYIRLSDSTMAVYEELTK
jgi:hypothetical protein